MGAAAAGLALAAVAVALTGPWDAGQREAERRAAAEAGEPVEPDPVAGVIPAAQAERVLAPLGTDAGGEGGEGGDGGAGLPGERALANALGPALDDAALGAGATGSVIDIATGRELYADGAGGPMTPASTVKILTGVAALHTLGADHRLTTTALWDAGHERVVLVGGGDTTLRSEDLRALAEDAAAALPGDGGGPVSVGFDASLYATELHPIGINDNIAPITPLQVDAGRLDDSETGPAPRAPDPATEAADEFAGYLRDAGVRVTGGPGRVGAAPEDAETLAVHRSAPLSTLVEEMLTHSDNDLAEALGRHVALATGHDGDAAGLRRAVSAQLAELGLPAAGGDGVRIADGSGLDRAGRVTAELLTGALRLAADARRPALRPVLTGLPVAGFTGTLADRYDPDGGTPAGAGAGLVRAKTGTLTGVNSLAGTAITPNGRVLAFAFLAEETTDPVAAQAALDTAAATLASCACR
ncbi:D-alanyl-D-alanine carboxypeptidase/D-alanyl-D-alanine endopeptidase [Streptomyces sp. 6N223]|uniref:D-alanyl-D-alanine carboxypeptidase/D-alanyl-D-alanine endopeptidase n=1 Tax=Streptomyces sp. 6N223 TaxID=3457412 RepID=UPI003FD2ED3D